MFVTPARCFWEPITGSAWEDRAQAFLADQGRRLGLGDPAPEGDGMLGDLERLSQVPGLSARNQALCGDLLRALKARQSSEGATALEAACRSHAFHPFIWRGIDPVFSQTVANFPWAAVVGKWASGSKAHDTHPCPGEAQPLLIEVRNPLLPVGLSALLAVVPLVESPQVRPGLTLSLRPWGSATPLALGGKVEVAGQVWPLAPEDWALWACGAERSGDLYEGCVWPCQRVGA